MKSLFVFIIMYSGIACSTGKTDSLGPIDSELRQVGDFRNYDVIFMIPSEGCGNCINTAESFMMDKYQESKKKGIFFIVTGHRSMKSAVLRFGKFVQDRKTVYVDTANRFEGGFFVEGYPKILLLKNGKVFDTKELRPETSADIYKTLN